MNLKDAFRAQNKLQALMDEASDILQDWSNTLKVTTTHLRNSEVVIANGGSGYRFNGEGNHVSYRCDAKRVTTINFGRNKIRGMTTELDRRADVVSARLDQCLVNTAVDYTLPFEMNDSFDTILSDCIQRQSA